MEQQHGAEGGVEGRPRSPPIYPRVALNIVEKRLVRNPDKTGIEQVYFDYACTPIEYAIGPRPQIARAQLFRENHTASERLDALVIAFHSFLVEPHHQNMANARLLVAGVERLQERCSRELAHLASPDFFSARFQNDNHEVGNAEMDDDDETVDDETVIEAGIQVDKKADGEAASKADSKADGKADNKEDSKTDEKSNDKAGNKPANEQGKKKKYQKRKPRVK